jgi:hypothetical protein
MSEKTISQKQTRNRREQIIGFIHVGLFFAITTVLCSFILSYYSSNSRTLADKQFAIVKMERIRDFQSLQNKQLTMIDSICSMIGHFNPGVQASYKENDIRYYLNDIKTLYEKSDYDKRYKVFYLTADFYNMWFADKQELWTKKQNINDFSVNLEDCGIGFQKKQEALKITK